MTIEGKAWKLGDAVDTDAIVPGTFLDAPLDEVVKHVFESIKPGFANEVRQGDVLVAGKNFGCGSSRENAPAALQKLGLSCIVAESFARIFFRNAIALGIPLVICPGVCGIVEEGDTLRVDYRAATVENTGTGARLRGEPLPEEVLTIIGKGGILEVLKGRKKP